MDTSTGTHLDDAGAGTGGAGTDGGILPPGDDLGDDPGAGPAQRLADATEAVDMLALHAEFAAEQSDRFAGLTLSLAGRGDLESARGAAREAEGWARSCETSARSATDKAGLATGHADGLSERGDPDAAAARAQVAEARFQANKAVLTAAIARAAADRAAAAAAGRTPTVGARIEAGEG
jgi:hypothetical protein